MGFFILVILMLILVPIARAIADRIGSSGPAPIEIDRVRRALEAAEQRAADGDQRVAQLEERVDFLERLLQAPKPGTGLPPSGGAAPPQQPH